jgi:hypothetical protein
MKKINLAIGIGAMFIIMSTLVYAGLDEIFIQGVVRYPGNNSLVDDTQDIFINITNSSTGTLLYSQTQSSQDIDSGVYHSVFDGIEHDWFLNDVSFNIKIGSDTFTEKEFIPAPMCHAAFVANESSYLNGYTAADLLDDTTIGNCSVTDSCDNIVYDNELIGNCSATNSCDNIFYDTEHTQASHEDIGVITTNNQSIYLDNTDYCSGGTCGSLIVDGDLTILGDTTNVTVNDSVVNGDYLFELHEVFSLGSPEKRGLAVHANVGCGNITSTASDLCTLTDTDTTIGNCSVDNSCDLITYDSELAYIPDTNCTTDGSCPLITYDSELAYIQNCSEDQTCDNVIYTTDKLGNTTTEIRAQFEGGANISIEDGIISFNMTCEQITGSADLCDGVDGVGGAGTAIWYYDNGVSYLNKSLTANNEQISALLDCNNITGATSNLCTLVDTDTTIPDTNCTTEGSCPLIAYDTELSSYAQTSTVETWFTNNRTYTDAYIAAVNTSQNINDLFADDLTTDDDTTYSSGDDNITLTGTVFTLGFVDLAELDNSVSAFITNSVNDLTNYVLTTTIETWFADNRTYTDNYIAAVNTSQNINDLFADDLSVDVDTTIGNCSVTDSCDNIVYNADITGFIKNDTNVRSADMNVTGNFNVGEVKIEQLNSTHGRIYFG